MTATRKTTTRELTAMLAVAGKISYESAGDWLDALYEDFTDSDEFLDLDESEEDAAFAEIVRGAADRAEDARLSRFED